MQSLLAIPVALQHRKGAVLAALAAVSLLEQPAVGVMAPPPPLPVPKHTIAVPDHVSSTAWNSMLRAGWLPGQGLGKDRQGRSEPVCVRARPAGRRRPGLGYKALPWLLAGPSMLPRMVAAAYLRDDAWALQPTVRPAARPAKLQPAPAPDARMLLMVHALAEQEGQADADAAHCTDVWDDALVMHYLRACVYSAGLSRAEQKRVQKRARRYVLQGDTLHRRMPDGSTRTVPPKADRRALVLDMHEQTGHFGEKRTAGLVSTMYWWRGMMDDVRAITRTCESCAKARATFNAKLPELQP